MKRTYRQEEVEAVLDAVVLEAKAKVSSDPTWCSKIDAAASWVRLQQELVIVGHAVFIPSDSRSGRSYEVNGTCQCEDATMNRNKACKHRIRARLAHRIAEAVEMRRKALASVEPEPVAAVAPAAASTVPPLPKWFEQEEATAREAQVSGMIDRLRAARVAILKKQAKRGRELQAEVDARMAGTPGQEGVDQLFAA